MLWPVTNVVALSPPQFVFPLLCFAFSLSLLHIHICELPSIHLEEFFPGGGLSFRKIKSQMHTDLKSQISLLTDKGPEACPRLHSCPLAGQGRMWEPSGLMRSPNPWWATEDWVGSTQVKPVIGSPCCLLSVAGKVQLCLTKKQRGGKASLLTLLSFHPVHSFQLPLERDKLSSLGHS